MSQESDTNPDGADRPPAARHKSIWHAIALWALITVGLLVVWLGMIYPLLPNSLPGWLACIGAGMAVGLWGTVSALLIKWLERQQRYRLLCRALAVVVALSLGCGILWIAANSSEFMHKNFRYVK